MARTATNHNCNTTSSTSTPFMDRLSHSVIKETSKNLRHYIDVKRRENAFVLNPNSSALDSSPLRARLIYGTRKEYPPLYGSCHTDHDIKLYLRNFPQQQRQPYRTSDSPEKQMCREELNFHMRRNKSPTKESQKFAELRLRPRIRSSSSCNIPSGREFQRDLPKPVFKLSRHEQNLLIDDTANILASMLKTRRSIHDPHVAAHTPRMYDSRHTNPTPRQENDQSNEQSSVQPPVTHSPKDPTPVKNIHKPEKQKHKAKNPLDESRAIMHKAKLITRGILCEYKVTVTTGNCNGASANTPIHIRLYGTNGYTEFIDLDNSETHRVPFSKGHTDVFNVETDHVGQLAGISIGHDSKDARSGWFLEKVSIFDPFREITSDIPCNAWLSSKSNDQKTMRDFPVASKVSPKKSIDSNEHRKEIDNQSDSSTTAMSDASNRIRNEKKRTKKKRKENHVTIEAKSLVKTHTLMETITKQLSQPPPVSTVESHFNPNELTSPVHQSSFARRSPIISSPSSSDTEIENNIVNHNRSRSSSSTFDRTHRSSTSDHDTPHITNHTTKRHSIEQDRPPARLEAYTSPPVSETPERIIKRKEETNHTIINRSTEYNRSSSARIEKSSSSPVSATPKRPIKAKEETNEYDGFDFFD